MNVERVCTGALGRERESGVDMIKMHYMHYDSLTGQINLKSQYKPGRVACAFTYIHHTSIIHPSYIHTWQYFFFTCKLYLKNPENQNKANKQKP